MKKSKELQKLARQLSELSFKDGKILDSKVGKSIKVLKTLPKYAAIEALSEYLNDLKRKVREHTMYIDTVVPLSPAQIQAFKKNVKNMTITKVLVNIDPEILGGFKMRIGDELLDGSVSGRIAQVREVIYG